MNLVAIPALTDNYIWMLHNGRQAIVVDPGEAPPVIATLKQKQLQLTAILITHHHADHTAGIESLRPLLHGHVWGPAKEAIASPYEPLTEGKPLSLLGLQIQVLDVPGHTAGHIAYYLPSQPNLKTGIVFSGDTLFFAGCGRIFEGTPQEMFLSLQKLSSLPDTTRLCCAHEYTLSNLHFAQQVEPENRLIANYLTYCEKLRQENKPTLPSLINTEKAINPFLRVKQADVRNAIQTHDPDTADDKIALFTALRQWKDHF